MTQFCTVAAAAFRSRTLALFLSFRGRWLGAQQCVERPKRHQSNGIHAPRSVPFVCVLPRWRTEYLAQTKRMRPLEGCFIKACLFGQGIIERRLGCCSLTPCPPYVFSMTELHSRSDHHERCRGGQASVSCGSGENWLVCPPSCGWGGFVLRVPEEWLCCGIVDQDRWLEHYGNACVVRPHT